MVSGLWAMGLLWSLMFGLAWRGCNGFSTFGFDVHHRFSDQVKGFLAVDELPEKGTVDYYSTMAYRDQAFRSRHLIESGNQTPVTFFNGNDTYEISSLGFLHYANITVGTPSLWYLVALDTGSDLFWLPCDCTSCVPGLINLETKTEINFNIYSPNTSSTSSDVSCSNSLCLRQRQCSSTADTCPYLVEYLSNDTSSTGFLVEDVLHLTPDDNQSKVIESRVTLGCGHKQTGSFLNGAAPNGLFGLGMSNISVPSILAHQQIASNSFSMCFGSDGVGRIRFGDKGSSDQAETPLNVLGQQHPSYNISITQINVNGSVADLEFNAIFDSGTSFTYLTDPAYTRITESFDSFIKETRHSSDPSIPFEYCYNTSSNQTTVKAPKLNLTMKGDNTFFVKEPLIWFSSGQVSNYFCLGLVKSNDINIIGQNFMTGYRIVFDREKMILGWKPWNCYDAEDTNTLAVTPSSSTVIPPATAVDPEATEGGSNNNTQISTAGNSLPCPNTIFLFLLIFLPIFTIL